MNKKIIAIFTGNRAEYGLQFPILRSVKDHPNLEYKLLVSGAHLDNNFGRTLEEIENDGSIYKDKNVEVIAFKNDHGDFENSFGFLFITKDKRILFSGDTGVSDNLMNYGENLDLSLIHI